jgi:hypothetical protein
MQYQGRVLAELHADKRYLAYLRDLEKNPRYQLTGPRPIRPGTKTRPPINEAELEAAACGTRSW